MQQAEDDYTTQLVTNTTATWAQPTSPLNTNKNAQQPQNTQILCVSMVRANKYKEEGSVSAGASILKTVDNKILVFVYNSQKEKVFATLVSSPEFTVKFTPSRGMIFRETDALLWQITFPSEEEFHRFGAWLLAVTGGNPSSGRKMTEIVVSAGDDSKNIQPGDIVQLEVSVWDYEPVTVLIPNALFYCVTTPQEKGINGVLLTMRKSAAKLCIAHYNKEFSNEELPTNRPLIFYLKVIDVSSDSMKVDKPTVDLETMQEMGKNIHKLKTAYRQQLALRFKQEMEQLFENVKGALPEENVEILRPIFKDQTLQVFQSLHFIGEEQLTVDEVQKATSMNYDNLKAQIERVNIVGQIQQSREKAFKLKEQQQKEREDDLLKKIEAMEKRESELQQKELKAEQKEIEEKKRQMTWSSLESGAAIQDVTLKKGYLVKQGHVVKNWKRRYFTLIVPKSSATSTGAVLYPTNIGWKGVKDAVFSQYYYKNPTDEKPAGIINVRSYDVKITEGATFVFSLVHPKEAARSFNIKAETAEEMADWMQAIKSATLI